jgi:hypothetical protein
LENTWGIIQVEGSNLWCESALRSHIDNQNNLASILGELNIPPINVLQYSLLEAQGKPCISHGQQLYNEAPDSPVQLHADD